MSITFPGYALEMFLYRQMQKATPFGKFYYNLSLFNRYGLMADDCIDDVYNPEVAEAIRRLPSEEYDQRNFRLIRAAQLELTKNYLPQNEWTKCEDPKNWYLQPYIQEVLAEMKEKQDWYTRHPQ